MEPVQNNRRAAALMVATAVLLAGEGCATHGADVLSHMQQVAALCPKSGTLTAAFVASDESGSRRGSTSKPPEQRVIREVAERTSVCGGHLRLTIFSGSMIGVTVFDDDLHLVGATQNARLRKVPKSADAVMARINTALPDATIQLGGGATDIVGQYQLGAEYVAQLSASAPAVLEQTILTDGIQTAAADLEDPSLTEQQAVDMASGFAVPDLSGATVRLMGIGRQADDAPLPTPYIAALRAFHAAICERTKATCTVVTDAAGA